MRCGGREEDTKGPDREDARERSKGGTMLVRGDGGSWQRWGRKWAVRLRGMGCTVSNSNAPSN